MSEILTNKPEIEELKKQFLGLLDSDDDTPDSKKHNLTRDSW